MASGTITGSTGNEYIDAKVEWSSTPNTSTNNSKVTAALYYKRNNTGYTTYGTGTFSITINGTKTNATKQITITENDWVKAVEATVSVNHNTDGRKSIVISATGSISGTSLTSTSVSGTVSLDTIPRASTIDSLSCATKYFNGKLTYKYTPKSSSYYNRCNISLNLNGTYTSVKSINLGTQSASQKTATVTLSESELSTIYNKLPKATKGVIRFTLRTYSDSGYSTQIGDAGYKELTLYIPNDTTTKPSVSASLAPSHSLTGDFASLYVQGKSKVKATITSSGKYGATIASQMMVVEGKTYDSSDSFTSGYLSGYGTIAVKITVTDSRGYSQTATKNITVLAYSNPKVVPASGEGAIICARCDANGNLSESGTYLKIKAKRSYSLCKLDGVQKNFCGLRYRYKKVGGAFSSWVTLLGAKTLTTEEVDTIQMGGALAVTSSYVVHVDAVDVVGNHTYATFDIPTDKVYWHRAGSRNSLGLGKYAERDNALDSDWDFYMNHHRISGLPTPTSDSEAVPRSYVDAADIKITKSLNAQGWYKVGTLSGDMCAVATITVGGIFVNNQASPSMVDIATQYNQARTFLRLPSLADNQISKIGVVKESTKVYGVYAYYNTALENTVSINIHIHMGAFESADLVVASVTDSDMLSSINVKQ